MNLDMRQQKLVDSVMKTYDREAVIQEIMIRFAKEDSANAQWLLSMIPAISSFIIQHQAKKVVGYYNSAQCLMIQMHHNNMDSRSFFATVLPVVQNMLPLGKSSISSADEKAYFDMFVRHFRDPKAFNWERDKTWADLYNYTDYLKMIEAQLRGEKK